MPEFGPSRGSLAEDVPLDGRLEDDLTSDAQSDISILEEDDLLTKIKPKSRRRRAVYVAVAAIVAVLVLMACLTIPSGKAPPRLLLLQLQGESELSQLSRAISCPPGACTLLESSAFAGVNGGLWLVSMDTDRSPVQTLSGLQAETPYFLLLRPDYTSPQYPDMLPVQDLFGLLAYTFILPPQSSTALSHNRGNRRLLNEKPRAIEHAPADSESGKESTSADSFLPGADMVYYPGYKGDSVAGALWVPDGKPLLNPQCHNITEFSAESAGGAEMGASQSPSVLSAADAQQVRTGEESTLLFGPIVFPKGATVGLRVDVWPKSAGELDAAHSRTMTVNVQQAPWMLEARDEWWRDTRSVELAPASPSAPLRACHPTQQTYTLLGEASSSKETHSNSPSSSVPPVSTTPESPPPIPPPASPPPSDSSAEVISQGNRSPASNSTDLSTQPPSPPPLSPPSPTDPPPNPEPSPSPPATPPPQQLPPSPPSSPPAPTVTLPAVETTPESPPPPTPPSPMPPSPPPPLQPPLSPQPPSQPPPAPTFILPDEGNSFYPALSTPPLSQPSADAANDGSPDSNLSPSNEPSDPSSNTTQASDEVPQQPTTDLNIPPSPPPGVGEVHDSSSNLPSAPSNGTSEASQVPLQPSPDTEIPESMSPPVAGLPDGATSGSQGNSSTRGASPQGTPVSPSPEPLLSPPPVHQSPPPLALPTSLPLPATPPPAAGVITQSFPTDSPPPATPAPVTLPPPPLPPPTSSPQPATPAPLTLSPPPPPATPPPAADVITQSFPTNSPPPATPAPVALHPPPTPPAPPSPSADVIIQSITSSIPPPPPVPIPLLPGTTQQGLLPHSPPPPTSSTPSPVDTSLIVQPDASPQGLAVSFSDQEVPHWLRDVRVPGMILSRVALQPPLGADNQGVVVALVGGGFTATGNLYSGDRYSAVATLVQRSSQSMVVVRPAADTFRSLVTRIVNPSPQPVANGRRLAQSQISSNLELRSPLAPISAGTQQLELDLELVSGAIIRIHMTFQVEQGASGGIATDDGEVFDMSQPAGGSQRNTGNDEQSSAEPGRLRPQKLVFLIVGPLMLFPIAAGVLLLLARNRQKLLNWSGGNQVEQQPDDDNIASETAAAKPTDCPVQVEQQDEELCAVPRSCKAKLQGEIGSIDISMPADQQVDLKQHPEIERLYSGNNALCSGLMSAADGIAEESRAAPRTLKTPAGANTNPLFESDYGMITPHADAQELCLPLNEATQSSASARNSTPSSPTRISPAIVEFGGMDACTSATEGEGQQDGPVDLANACGEGFVEVAGQCSMDLGALTASPLRPSTSASQPPRSPASMALRDSLPGAIVGWEIPSDHSSP